MPSHIHTRVHTSHAAFSSLSDEHFIFSLPAWQRWCREHKNIYACLFCSAHMMNEQICALARARASTERMGKIPHISLMCCCSFLLFSIRILSTHIFTIFPGHREYARRICALSGWIVWKIEQVVTTNEKQRKQCQWKWDKTKMNIHFFMTTRNKSWHRRTSERRLN